MFDVHGVLDALPGDDVGVRQAECDERESREEVENERERPEAILECLLCERLCRDVCTVAVGDRARLQDCELEAGHADRGVLHELV